MKKDTKRKMKAVLYLIGGFMLTLILSEVIFLLGFYPLFDDGQKGLRHVLFVLWMYGWMYAFYRLSRSKTSWWKILDEKKGGDE